MAMNFSLNSWTHYKTLAKRHPFISTDYKAQKRGGVTAHEIDWHLLYQFCRRCWDIALLADLQLERKRDDPTSFAQLFLQLRKEDDKHRQREQDEKTQSGYPTLVAGPDFLDPTMQADLSDMQAQMTKLKKQVTKMKAQKADSPVTSSNNIVKELKAQIAELLSHFARLKTPSVNQKKTDSLKTNKTKLNPNVHEQNQVASTNTKNRPNAWYCFWCGEDGHIVSACSNDPNLSVVAEKRNQLKEKQSQWDRQNKHKQYLN